MKRVHKWNEEDAIITLYYERFGVEGLGMTEKVLAECVIGASVGSLRMMRSNHAYLMTGEGFEHYSENQEKAVYKYGKSSREELRDIVKNIIDKRDLSGNKKEVSKR